MDLYHKNFIIVAFFLILFNLSPAKAQPDKYEPNNTWEQANIILINNYGTIFQDIEYETSQSHNFFEIGDTDWVKFYAVKDEYYSINVKNPGQKCDVIIELYVNRPYQKRIECALMSC